MEKHTCPVITLCISVRVCASTINSSLGKSIVRGVLSIILFAFSVMATHSVRMRSLHYVKKHKTVFHQHLVVPQNL